MKSKHDTNFILPLRDGDFVNEEMHLSGIPNKLSPTQRKRYVPYVNIYDQRGLVGTLLVKDLRRLRTWMKRVGI